MRQYIVLYLSQNWNIKKTQYIYFGLSRHHQELHETEKYRIYACFDPLFGPFPTFFIYPPQKILYFLVSCNSWRWPDKPKYIYWVCLLFQFCDTYLEVPLISKIMHHLELTPELYNLIWFYYIEGHKIYYKYDSLPTLSKFIQF